MLMETLADKPKSRHFFITISTAINATSSNRSFSMISLRAKKVHHLSVFSLYPHSICCDPTITYCLVRNGVVYRFKVNKLLQLQYFLNKFSTCSSHIYYYILRFSQTGMPCCRKFTQDVRDG